MRNPNLPPAEYDVEGDPEFNWGTPGGIISDGIEFIPLPDQSGLNPMDADELRFGYSPSREGGSEN